jgi:release factor glutamine methyltransferase
MAKNIQTIRRKLIAAMQDISPQPETDAQHLLAKILGTSVSYLYSHPEQTLSTKQEEMLNNYLQRFLQHEPLAYILAQQEFYGSIFYVDPYVLIPRASTEYLVEWVLNNFTDKKNFQVLELGTGSGCIACSLALHKPNWEISATDISTKALEIAAKNAAALACTQLRFKLSNWFASIEGKFDLIISNPPYIAFDDECFTEKSLSFEPKSALISNDNGLADIKEIITAAKNFLKANGSLIIEHGNAHADEIKYFLMHNGYSNIITIKDLAGHERFSVAYLVKPKFGVFL